MDLDRKRTEEIDWLTSRLDAHTTLADTFDAAYALGHAAGREAAAVPRATVYTDGVGGDAGENVTVVVHGEPAAPRRFPFNILETADEDDLADLQRLIERHAVEEARKAVIDAGCSCDLMLGYTCDLHLKVNLLIEAVRAEQRVTLTGPGGRPAGPAYGATNAAGPGLTT